MLFCDLCFLCFVFFKQKTAYEMRISDWSSDVCSSDLCYVYAYSEEAIFKASGYGGELIFFDSKDKCDVKAVFGLSKQKAGKYVVTVSREDDDWYEVLGTDSYIKTSTRSEEHTSELQSLMRISYAVFCLKKKTKIIATHTQLNNMCT